ncbi:MAG: D-cysteine desulfhydrase family protein [Deltaproteobacteria bacterium]|nr:D-cysteine desulfhydrase family protein [Deltaproteobacteria bacterium]
MDEKILYVRGKLESFPKVSLSIVPTPCHRLRFLSGRYGVEVYCKRDDMSGFGFGGNKSRKLEFLVGEALHHRCDTLVTCGGIQSNFCRLTAAVGAACDLSVHLVLGGDRPQKSTGNVLLDEMLGAEMHHVDSPDWNEWERQADRITEELEARGRKVFRMPVGGSVPVGVAGYTAAFLEILMDQARLGIEFDLIVHATGSGGTQAGLVVGKELTAWPGRIMGVSVAMERHAMEEKIADLAVETASLFGGRVRRDSIEVDDRHIGPGYAVKTAQGEKAVTLFARREGVFLDYVYTGKAAGALLDWLERGLLGRQKVLFLHTGGAPELFA